MTEEQCQKYSKLIKDKILSLKQYKDADILLIYAGYGSEVTTGGIIEHALCHSKRVFCPKVLAPGNMEFYEILSTKELICGYKNIPEPSGTGIPYEPRKDINALMILPLVAFDSARMRIGYGGGFYDRYLQKHPYMKKIAIGFECQKYESIIDGEETDIRPDFILTETSCY